MCPCASSESSRFCASPAIAADRSRPLRPPREDPPPRRLRARSTRTEAVRVTESRAGPRSRVTWVRGAAKASAAGRSRRRSRTSADGSRGRTILGLAALLSHRTGQRHSERPGFSLGVCRMEQLLRLFERLAEQCACRIANIRERSVEPKIGRRIPQLAEQPVDAGLRPPFARSIDRHARERAPRA